MLGIGFWELCLIVGAVLVFFGPQKLPELMKQAGKLFVQVRRMTNDVKATMETVIQEAEAELKAEEAKLKHMAQLKREEAAKNITPPASVEREGCSDTPPKGFV